MRESRPLDGNGGSSDSPLVSIVIPTLNSEATLRATLQSIRRQTYPNIEVVVVDGHSEDSTRQIATEFKNVKVYLGGRGRSAQVNVGARVARGKYLYRVDSDFILEPDVVREAVEKCERGAEAILIHNTSDPTISLWSKARKLERDCYRDTDFHVAVRFMRRSDFERVGGFSESLIGAEDYDIHNRLVKMGIRVDWIESQEVHIGEPKRLKDVVLKHVYYGKHIRDFLKSNPSIGWKQVAPLRFSFVIHWRDFLVDPRTTLAFFLYQYVRYLSAIAGALASY